MLRHRNIDRICCLVLVAVLLLTCGYMGAGAAGWIASQQAIGYENRLFDTSRVHMVDIVMEEWDTFLATCTDEEYVPCHVVIDGESYKNVAIRAKGNTSLSSVQQYGNNRYSFKIEFDHYQPGSSYHGLDKLSLNNLIQDNTYMKDYFAYTLMRKGGANAPLCSFVQISVNGQPWGLYLAVEGVEDSFLHRNYGNDAGELYKPDSLSFGGGRGNGKGFDMEDFRQRMTEEGTEPSEAVPWTEGNAAPPGFGGFDGNSAPSEAPGASDLPAIPADGVAPPQGFGQMPPEGAAEPFGFGGDSPFGQNSADDDSSTANSMPDIGRFGGADGFSMGSSDVLLQYTDDDPASYSNIFENAKTNVNEADQQRLIQALKALSEGDTSVVDTNAVIRYLAVHNFLCNDDSYTGAMVHNYYLYEKDGVLSMLPWDYNLAFGGFGMGGGAGADQATATVNQPIDSPVTSGDISTRPIIAWIFNSEETLAAYHQAYEQFISVAFDSGWFAQEIDRVSALIAPYVKEDPTAFCTYKAFQQGASALKEFCLLRAQSVTGQLSGSIPATSEGQRNTDALVDASHLNLSDMGSMGNTHGGGNRPGGGGFGRGQNASGFGKADRGQHGQTVPQGGPAGMPGKEATEASSPFPAATAPEEAILSPVPDGQAAFPEAMRAQPPEGSGASPDANEQEWLLIACFVVLLGAIVLMSRYRSNL